MLSGIVGNIRGFARSIVRGAASIGRTLEETFDTLVNVGLEYAQDLVTIDFEKYNVQPFVCDEIRKMDRDRLIPGTHHVETDLSLSTKFRYEVLYEFEDVKGNKFDQYWTVASKRRLTQNEILDLADDFIVDSPTKAVPVTGEISLVGSWVRED